MAEIIKTAPNQDGKVIVRIFHDDYDVTDRIVNGEARLEIYGKVFLIRIPKQKAKKPTKKIKVKKAKDNGLSLDVSFIESPEES